MQRTVVVAAAVVLGSVLAAADGIACWFNVGDVCVFSPSQSVVMTTIAVAMLVPTITCLVIAWLDARLDAQSEEKTSLLHEGGSPTQAPTRPRRVVAYLYCGHILSTWGDRMWQFALPILFMEIFVDTLLPSACFQLGIYAACLMVIPSVGKLLDRMNRWTAMKFAISIENVMIVLSTVLLVSILIVTDADGQHKPTLTWKLVLLFGATLVCGCIAQILNNAQTIGLERDWVVVIAGKNSEYLSHLNTMMRRIDLLCLIFSPLVFGMIMDFAGTDPTKRTITGAVVVGIWNLISTPLEYAMTEDIYDLVPELANREQSTSPRRVVEKPSGGAVKQYIESWGEYARHPIFLLSLSFCFLYMTVLSGGALNIAYLKWRNVPNSILGMTQGANAISGLLGTLMFPYLRSWIGRLEHVVVWCVSIFWLTLAPNVLTFVFVGESQASDVILMVSVALSRMWLYTTDLSETQLMQEWVEAHERGSINAMQTATSQFFFILILIVGIVFHDPRQFEMLVFFSVGAVLASVIGTLLWYLWRGRAGIVSSSSKGDIRA